MARRICWQCGVASHMTLLHVYAAAVQPQEGDPLVGFYKCDFCAAPSAAYGGTYFAGDQVEFDHREAPQAQLRWLPKGGLGREFPDVPDHIAAAADEAFRCRSIDALRGAVILCRTVIEATAKEKGIQKGNLAAKIDALEAQGYIRPYVKDAAHEIRWLGNDMAHGDFTAPVQPEEADEILELMDEVLAEVFQSPARVARRQAARKAKASSQP